MPTKDFKALPCKLLHTSSCHSGSRRELQTPHQRGTISQFGRLCNVRGTQLKADYES
jgi:hypothetical protein